MSVNVNHNSNAKDPLVSVLMPVFNGERYLREAIDSMLNQTYSHFELIILNDGSSDRSQSILDSYTDKRIRLLKHNTNQGLTTSRNELVAAARGKYIAFLDCDDIALPDRLALQVKYMERNIADIIGADHFTLYQSTGRIKRSKQSYRDPDIRALLCICSPLCNPAVMGVARVFKEHPYRPDTEVAEDYALWQELALAGYRFANLKSIAIYYRVHETQISQASAERNQVLFSLLQKRYLDGLGINSTDAPRALPWKTRIRTASHFMRELNKKIKGISVGVNYQIYARFQYRNNGLLTPLTRLERLLISLIASWSGRL